MRDEIREKYGKWLGTPGDRSKVGEMTEKELLLGRTLKRMREHRQIPLECAAQYNIFASCSSSHCILNENICHIPQGDFRLPPDFAPSITL